MEAHEFEVSGHRIAYYTAGPKDGKQALLVHGFTGSAQKDYINPGWLEMLAGEGRYSVAIDHLGHGKSDKPEGEAALYAPSAHAARLKALADHLNLQVFDLIGYSMGGRISIEYALTHPDSVDHFTLVGVGLNVLGQSFLPSVLLKVFKSMIEAPEALTDDMKNWHKMLVDEGQNLGALYTCAQGIPLEAVDLIKLIQFERPTQIVQAMNDPIGAGADRLAGVFKAQHVEIEGADHVSVMPDGRFHKAVLKFWKD